MKRNMDLVRDIMIEIEEKSSLERDGLRSGELIDVGRKYDTENILWHCELLIEAGFVKGKSLRTMGGLQEVIIQSLSWDGTEFLDAIRRKTVWERTKERMGSSSAPLKVIERVAGEILMKMATGE